MLRLNGSKGVRFCDGLTRRDFFRVGTVAAGSLGVSLADVARLKAAGTRDVNCILLFLVGGPGQLDTWDPKPGAPDNVRGPFRPIRTSVPGTQVAETFPRMASMAERYAIVRSVHHRAAAIHETGHQLMQTGRLFHGELDDPHYGSVLSHLRGPRVSGVPPYAVVPGPICNTGVSISHGQGAGYLGSRHEPYFPGDLGTRSLDPARPRSRHELLDAVDHAQRLYETTVRGQSQDAASAEGMNLVFAQTTRRAFDLAAENDGLRDRYGRNTFGQSCLLARRLIEHGVRLVTVNMFDTVFNRLTWDCHADGGSLAVTLDDYRETLCPMFDLAYTALLDDLYQRGLLDTTLVLAMGEFGRTPQLNAQGGRDHWPGVWSVLFAGGGVRGGQVIGASDRIAAEPHDRPIDPAMIAASVYTALGIDPKTVLPAPGNRRVPLCDAEPVAELFGA